MADDEGHDAGIGVVSGPGDQREAADHLALHDVTHRTTRCARTLLGEDAIVIAVIGLWLASSLVAFRRRFRRESAKRAVVAVRRPVETVLLAGTGDDALRIDARTVAAILL